jgi:threonine dehydratase
MSAIDFTLEDLRSAATLVHSRMPPTPQYAWPLIAQRFGCSVVIKHENHTPTGAFKVRGGLVYLERLQRERPHIRGIVSATRGNHGQSLAFAGRSAGLPVVIVAPRGNSVEKNAAMRAFGAELIEEGADFDAAKARAAEIAAQRGYEFVPSFQRDLVLGVATYALELFSTHADLDTVYVPVGLGSGICGLIRTRDLLGLKTNVVGVVSENAQAYALSVAAGHVVETNSAMTFADGIAVRIPDRDAVNIIAAGAEKIITVSEDEIAAAIRIYWTDTHNAAEGAGASPLAAIGKDKALLQGKKVAAILCGQNIDRSVMVHVLSGLTPLVG